MEQRPVQDQAAAQVASKDLRSLRWHPYDASRAVCPCNDLAHSYPEVAAEWEWGANAERTPETVAASSSIKAAWRV